MGYQVVIFGGGGHARVVIDALQLASSCSILGILDASPSLQGKSIYGIPVVGNDDLLPQLIQAGATAFAVGVGSIGHTHVRQHLYVYGLSYKLFPLTVCHPDATCSSYARLGQGVHIMARAIINAGAVVGDNCIINSGAIVEHDCLIAEHCHIASGAVLSGGVQIGAGTHIGAGAVVRQGIRIGENVIVGAGAAVVKDIPSGQRVIGVPAKPLLHMQLTDKD